MAKGDFLDRQRKMQQTYLDIGEEMGVQKAWDYLQIILRDPEIMGKNVMGVQKIKKVYKKLSEVADHYKIAFSDHVEADHVQEELDGVLKEVWGDELVPFYERYPYLKKFDYTKGKKQWK